MHTIEYMIELNLQHPYLTVESGCYHGISHFLDIASLPPQKPKDKPCVISIDSGSSDPPWITQTQSYADHWRHIKDLESPSQDKDI
jgi:hypothetical protein